MSGRQKMSKKIIQIEGTDLWLCVELPKKNQYGVFQTSKVDSMVTKIGREGHIRLKDGSVYEYKSITVHKRFTDAVNQIVTPLEGEFIHE
jgi:hypothetical protein